MLSVLLALPALMAWFASAPAAQAQSSIPQTVTQWAVLDFVNHSAYGGDEVGRQASDSLVVELGKSNRYDISPRDDIQKSIDKQGLQLPLGTTEVQKLGRDLGVSGVVTGEVVGVSFNNNPRIAHVTIAARVVDPISGEVVNGALAQGASTPRAVPTNDDDSLVNQAIDAATFVAVKQLQSNHLPVATILSNQQNVILLNKGSRDGLHEGMQLIVNRHGVVVGKLKIFSVTADDSSATILADTQGIRPQDTATVIYEVPKYSVKSNGQVITANDSQSALASSHKSNNGNFSGIGGVILAIVVAALLLRVAHGGTGSGALANSSVGNAHAVFGRVNDPYTGGFGVGGVAPVGVNTADYVPVVVHITADTGNIPYNNFDEYHVFRADFSSFEGIPIIAVQSQGPLSVFDDGGTQTFTYSVPDTIQANLLDTFKIATYPSGIPLALVGQRFNYTVQGLWSSTSLNGPPQPGGGNPGAPGLPTGTGNGGTTTTVNAGPYHLSSLSPTNYVTYIEPPFLSSTQFTGTSKTNVNLNVPSTRGADDYVLDISTSAVFTTQKTYRPLSAVNPFSAPQTTPRQGSPINFLTNANLSADFPGQTVLFARVGARDSRNNGQSGFANDYIYSDPVQVPAFLLQ